MLRRDCAPRPDWRQRVESIGFDFHTLHGAYWVEDACYAFAEGEIDAVEDAVNALHAMCLDLVAAVVASGDYEGFGLGPLACAQVEASWRAGEPALYGRMDLAYDGIGPPRLLEYNADTPTSLLEASVVQWHWLEDTGALPDQFNSIHEALLQRWTQILPAAARVHFAGCLEALEDAVTLDYLRATCEQAGFATGLLDMSAIGWKDGFKDLADRPIEHAFKLYPWEWMMDEPFAAHLLAAPTRWIEPAWKQLLSNKSLLPALWQRFPGHPNLLAAAHDPRELDGPVVGKPRFGREGEGVFVAERGVQFAEPGYVYQAQAPLFRHGDIHALLGGWVVGDRAVGLGVREDAGCITRNSSRFVPHGFY